MTDITKRDTSNPVYQAWANMKKRCLNPHYPQYMEYGGRGITVCSKWLEFDGFLKDMGPSWSEGLELDRINNLSGYSAVNCRWTTRTKNNQNRRIKSSSSKYRGVRFHKRDKKWGAHLSVNNKVKYLGYFITEEEAALAYDDEAVRQFGPEASLNFPLIRVRDDDVLGDSSSWSDTLGRFKQVHEWIVDAGPRMIHIPCIVVDDLKQKPDAIRFVREETKKGRMIPEVHGKEHIDYKQLPKEEIIEHLNYCKDFIFHEFGRVPRRFMTPWGANAPHIYDAAFECGLALVDCSDICKLQGEHSITRRLMDGEPVSNFFGYEIFMHYWEGGARLARVCQTVKWGSWEEAKKHNKELFK
jgi:hypothetical protein